MLKRQCLFEAMPIPALAGSRTPAVLTGDAVWWRQGYRGLRSTLIEPGHMWPLLNYADATCRGHYLLFTFAREVLMPRSPWTGESGHHPGSWQEMRASPVILPEITFSS